VPSQKRTRYSLDIKVIIESSKS